MSKPPNLNELLVLKYCATAGESYASEVARVLQVIPASTVAAQLGSLWDKGYLSRRKEVGCASELGRPIRLFYQATESGFRRLTVLEHQLSTFQAVYGVICDGNFEQAVSNATRETGRVAVQFFRDLLTGVFRVLSFATA